MLELYGGTGRTRLRMRVLRMGEDMCVLLDGGHKPHMGAMALAGAGAPASALTLPGHREDDLARRLSENLSAALGVSVAVLCGIHVADVTRDEIALIYETAHSLARELPRLLAARGNPPC